MIRVRHAFFYLLWGLSLPGNGTVEKLQQVFISSGQKYGGLVLDLHCNRFGPTALFQVYNPVFLLFMFTCLKIHFPFFHL